MFRSSQRDLEKMYDVDTEGAMLLPQRGKKTALHMTRHATSETKACE